jgi:outer membrane protein assembly factor BamB
LAADWPHFLGPTHNGISPETNLARVFAKEGPPVVWQRTVGQGFSGPVISRGQLILFHRLGDQETIESLDATTGRPLWKSGYLTGYQDDFGFDEGPRATPAVAGDFVYTYGADGMLACWRFETGAKEWTIDTQKEFGSPKGYFGRVCSPLVEGDAVILNLGGRRGAGIVAFHRQTGRVLWRASDDEASYSSPVAATIKDQRRIFVVTRGALAALDPADGRVIFEHSWRPHISASVSAATPLVVDDLIFLSASYGAGAMLLRYGEKKPEQIWASDEALSNHYATSVHHRGFLYGFDGRQEQGCELRCVELKTGHVRWKKEGLKAGTVTLAGDQLLVLTERGQLLVAPATPDAFKPGAPAQILPSTVRAYPALANGRFYARSKDKLVCVEVAQDERGGETK